MTSAFVPPAGVLLEAAVDHLERELLPTLSGAQRFQIRVTVNALRIVQRELALAPGHAEAERARLAALLGHDGEPAALRAELAAAIADARIALDDARLTDHLRRTLRDALAIDHPNWAAAARDSEDPR